MNAPHKSSITESIEDVVRNLGGVVQNEVRLAKAESSLAIKGVTGGLATLAAGVALVVPALTLLGMAVADILAEQTAWAPSTAGAVVGAALGVLGILLVWAGRKAMTSSHAALPTTTANIKQDIHTLKEATQ